MAENSSILAVRDAEPNEWPSIIDRTFEGSDLEDIVTACDLMLARLSKLAPEHGAAPARSAAPVLSEAQVAKGTVLGKTDPPKELMTALASSLEAAAAPSSPPKPLTADRGGRQRVPAGDKPVTARVAPEFDNQDIDVRDGSERESGHVGPVIGVGFCSLILGGALTLNLPVFLAVGVGLVAWIAAAFFMPFSSGRLRGKILAALSFGLIAPTVASVHSLPPGSDLRAFFSSLTPAAVMVSMWVGSLIAFERK